jgi:hypothetical protein
MSPTFQVCSPGTFVRAARKAKVATNGAARGMFYRIKASSEISSLGSSIDSACYGTCFADPHRCGGVRRADLNKWPSRLNKQIVTRFVKLVPAKS